MTEVLTFEESTHKNESLLYESLDDEYKTISWLGGIEIMKNIWQFHQGFSGDKNSEFSLFINFCEAVSKNPKSIQKKINKWIQNNRSNTTRLDILRSIGVIEKIGNEASYELVTVKNFEHALEIHNMSKKNKNEFIQESNIGRHLPILGELVALYDSQLIELNSTNGKLVEQFSTVIRDIDFYVGHYDPNKEQN